jgi:hypothetical protein
MKIIYEAQDGKQFKSESECKKYEQVVKAASMEAIEKFYDLNDNVSVGKFIVDNIDQLVFMVKGE